MHTLEQLRAGELAGIKRLSLAAGLTDFPPEIFTLADSLEILDLSGNQLTCLPDDLPRLHRLRIVFCSDNPFTELPAVLGRCQGLQMIGFKSCRIERVPAAALPDSLRWLVLTDNRITELPPQIGRCSHLQKLMLAGNRLTALPDEMAGCTGLELLRIAANAFTAFPAVLAQLPRLSWLAIAGNPFCQAQEADSQEAQDAQEAPVAGIDWDRLQLVRKLGEGASGVIHEALWHSDAGQRVVAIKLFKGAVTSDGLPAREMAACIAAGAHPGLIPVLGRLHGHPQGTPGLVMPLIDPAFLNLAGPPSLDSCTRDVYPEGTRFDWPHALGIARDIAAAAAHLHQRGIVHGDLYGHNILHRAQGPERDWGQALLGDFGAASMVAPQAAYAPALQAMEVRAFGCLLEELLAHCDDAPHAAAAALADLRDACLAPRAAVRPSFAVIVPALEALMSSS